MCNVFYEQFLAYKTGYSVCLLTKTCFKVYALSVSRDV